MRGPLKGGRRGTDGQRRSDADGREGAPDSVVAVGGAYPADPSHPAPARLHDLMGLGETGERAWGQRGWASGLFAPGVRRGSMRRAPPLWVYADRAARRDRDRCAVDRAPAAGAQGGAGGGAAGGVPVEPAADRHSADAVRAGAQGVRAPRVRLVRAVAGAPDAAAEPALGPRAAAVHRRTGDREGRDGAGRRVARALLAGAVLQGPEPAQG